MQLNIFIVLSLCLLPSLAGSSSLALKKTSIVKGKICEQMLKSWKLNDTDVNSEEEYELKVKQKSDSKSELLSNLIIKREQLVEYQREFN